jgi:UvrD-like helicase C-terminal domain/AAA domain
VVIYPKAKIEGQLPPSQEPQVIIAYRDMDRLHERLVQTFKLWGPTGSVSAFTIATTAIVTDTLRDGANFIAVAAAGTDDVDEQIERLTRQQYETYRGLLGNARALVSGRAGSGKTMLGIWTARELAQRGRTLFLCFNKTLAKWLQERDLDVKNLEICTFHSICARLSSQAGLSWNPREQDPEFWADSAPNILADALDRLGASAKYDAVVVDEGQDFHPNWWIAIELLLRSEREGVLFIFHDPDQAIQFRGTSSYPLIATTFKLDANCRNTRRIAGYCANVLGSTVTCMEGLPEGATPEIGVVNADARSRANVCRTSVRAWLEEGYVKSRIAILSPFREDHPDSALKYLLAEQAGTIRFETDPEAINHWLDGKAIWCSTIKRFKGLEADCLIVADIPSTFSSGFSLNDLYVAVSRAKHNVLLLPCDGQGSAMLHKFLPAER